jgi:hypothetical protein
MAQAAAETNGAATREYVVGGAEGVGPYGGFHAAAAVDDVVRQYGPWVYDLMRLDPAVSGSLNLLFAGILAEGPRVQVKPRSSWLMLADPYLRVRKVRCLTADGWRDVDRSHFVLMSWQPRCGDPRGTRLLRPAYPAWNIKLQAIPDYAEYLKHFADPKLILTAGPDALPTLDVDGTELTPQQRLLVAARLFSNNSAMALANGDTAQYLYSQGNGEAYLKGFDWADREIFRSIIIGARAMQEAKHSSKADTDTSEDLIGMAVTQARKPLHEATRNDLLYRGTVLNWGKDVADRFTPSLAFGISDHLSPTIMKALTDAWSRGVLQAPQRPWMLSKIGAPQDPEGYAATQPGTTPPAPGADPGAKPDAGGDGEPEDPEGQDDPKAAA